MWIKYCGFTRREDLDFAASLQIDAVGFIFYDKSKRYITPQRVREITDGFHGPKKVGIFVGDSPKQINEAAKIAGLDLLQLIAGESADDSAYDLPLMKVYHIADADDLNKISHGTSPFLLDAMSTRAMGGTGERFDWSMLKNFGRLSSTIIAGGVSVDNAHEIVRLNPYGVDLSSSIEDAPGLKSHDKMKNLHAILSNGTAASREN